MHIAIIGAGTAGSALTGSFVRPGRSVVITSREFVDAGTWQSGWKLVAAPETVKAAA